MRRCCRCKKRRRLTSFYRDKNKKHGRGYVCRDCSRDNNYQREEDYWNRHRARRIKSGLCEKCPEREHRFGLCERHYLANLLRTSRRMVVPGRTRFTCKKCGEPGHMAKTCDLRKKYPDIVAAILGGGQ